MYNVILSEFMLTVGDESFELIEHVECTVDCDKFLKGGLQFPHFDYLSGSFFQLLISFLKFFFTLLHSLSSEFITLFYSHLTPELFLLEKVFLISNLLSLGSFFGLIYIPFYY